MDYLLKNIIFNIDCNLNPAHIQLQQSVISVKTIHIKIVQLLSNHTIGIINF